MGDIVEFETMGRHQKIFYKVTSSAIKFEVKSPGGAAIGLAHSLASSCKYIIVLGDNHNTYSWIKRLQGSEQKKMFETPNILSENEYRHFWVAWNGNSIKLSFQGYTNPIVSCKGNAVDVKFVTFFAISGEHYDTPMHWRVELPPLLEKPSFKPLTVGKLTWVPIEADTTVLPDGSLIGGYEKENLYIVRAGHRGSMTPGKFVPSEGSAFISWGGEAHCKNNYEVLVGFDCVWVPTKNDKIPVGAVVGGYSEDIEHEKLYVGRAKHLNHIIPGKVQPSHKVCYIPFDGKEIAVRKYEVLVVPETRRCANTILLRQNDPTDSEEDSYDEEHMHEDDLHLEDPDNAENYFLF